MIHRWLMSNTKAGTIFEWHRPTGRYPNHHLLSTTNTHNIIADSPTTSDIHKWHSLMTLLCRPTNHRFPRDVFTAIPKITESEQKIPQNPSLDHFQPINR